MGIKTFTLRLDPDLHAFLEEESMRQGISKNDYIRNLIRREKENPNSVCVYSDFFQMLNELNGSIDMFNESVADLKKIINVKQKEK